MLCSLWGAIAMAAPIEAPPLPVDHLESRSGSNLEKSVREAAVRVTVPFTGGHGSGSYIKYKDLHLVITAQHVVDGRTRDFLFGFL